MRLSFIFSFWNSEKHSCVGCERGNDVFVAALYKQTFCQAVSTIWCDGSATGPFSFLPCIHIVSYLLAHIVYIHTQRAQMYVFIYSCDFHRHHQHHHVYIFGLLLSLNHVPFHARKSLQKTQCEGRRAASIASSARTSIPYVCAF